MLQPGQPGVARRTTWRCPLETLAVGSEGTRPAELAQATGARFFLASTSEVYGDPAVHPQTESYWGNVNPVGPAERLRRGQALRRGPDHGPPPHAGTDVGIVRIFNTYGPRLRPDDGRVVVQLHRPGPAGRAADRLRRREPDPELLLRRRRGPGPAGPARLRAHRSGQHRQPRRVHRAWSWPDRSSSSPVRRRPSCTSPARRRPGPAAPRHHPGPPRSSGGSPTHSRRLARTAATSGRAAEAAAGPADWPEGLGQDGAVAIGPTTDTARGGRRACRSPARLPDSCSVIVPVFNERTTVAEIIRRMRAVELPIDLRDHRGRRRLHRRHGQGPGRAGGLDRPGHHPPGQPGQGRGLRTGLAAARGDLVLIQDADLEYDPEDWPRLLDPILRGQATGGLRQPVHRRAGEHDAAPLARQPLPVPGDQRALQHHPVGHGDRYKLFDRQVLDGITIAVGPVRLRAGDHRQGAAPRAPDLRGAGLLRRPRGRRGEEVHLARRVRGAAHAWSGSASPGSIRERVGWGH